MSKLVKLVGTGIGLATEAVAAHKARSKSPAQAAQDGGGTVATDSRGGQQYVRTTSEHPNEDDEDQEDSSVDLDEQDWALDEAVDEKGGRGPSYEANVPPYDTEEIVRAFELEHPPPPYTPSIGRLECPVILPQRRPENKSRGFVKAYAPMLSDCGIDQNTFLDFLAAFDHAIQASPIFNVINIAAFGVSFVPSVAAQVASTLANIAAETGKRVQERHRTNAFLDQMNDKLFKPHGVYCLIMSYKPESKETAETLDITKIVSKAEFIPESSFQKQRRNLRLTSGKTYGELEMPLAAPLIFPALEAAPEAQKQNALKKSGVFVSDYLDRRAQATYTAENPDSSLNVAPAPKFASRYSDPNHPASSGSLIALVTGGALNPRELRATNKDARRERMGKSPSRRGAAGGRKKAKKGIKKLLSVGVLYMMIVNMPSQEEIEAAKAQVLAK